jgi:hypothetical protein
VLAYPAAIPLSTRSLNHLAGLIRAHHNQRRSRWRRLDPGRQALLALAHLRNGDTLARLASGFQIGVTTAWRYVREAIDLLAATADDLEAAMIRIRLLAYVILDGNLIPIDRVADQKPYYSGKHRRHGVNVQVIADAAGRLVWASTALPGAVHDLTAARTHAIIKALTSANVMTFADKAYQGARGSIRAPFQTAPLPAETLRLAEEGQPGTRPDPRHRRTRQRHPQDLEDPDETPLQPAPSDPDRAGHPRPTPRREPDLLRMKKAHCRSRRGSPLRISLWRQANDLTRLCPLPAGHGNGSSRSSFRYFCDPRQTWELTCGLPILFALRVVVRVPLTRPWPLHLSVVAAPGPRQPASSLQCCP